MKLRKWLPQKSFLAPVIGLLFAFFLCFVNSHQATARPLDLPSPTPLTILADLDDPAVPITPDEPTEPTNEPTEPTDEPTEPTTDPSDKPEEETTAEPTDSPTDEPGEGTENKTPAEATEDTEEETPETCYDQVKGIGWLVCPTSGVIAQAIDSIYKIIEDLLVVQPMTTDNESPIFTVWQYVRDLTNIVFIILIIVVIYSQLTGVGFDNYNIKKILPKIIITAILINLSYIICSAFVDTSNIIGASLRGFFENIETSIDASGEALVSWEALAGVLTGGGAIAGFAISASGGLGAFIWMLLPTLLAAILAIAVGLVTIAMRQAVVALLVMIAPLAFVCYMLPNTNKWFAKWKDALVAMLIFFPMFSLLFGASHLAGWALIVKAQQDSSTFTLILGMAVQVIPFFLCVPMMKMSGSVLGQVSNLFSGFANGINSRVKAGADDRRDTARARKLEEAARSRNFLSGARWAAYSERKKFERAESRTKNEESMKNTFSLYSNARRTGRRITGWDQNGRAIYATHTKRDENGKIMRDEDGKALRTDNVKITRDFREEYRNREIKLAAEADKLKTDNAMSNVEAYLRSTDTIRNRAAIDAMAKGQAQNYLDLRTQQSAKARNDRADQRFYFEQVQKASELDKTTGDVINKRLHDQLVRAGAGADAYDISKDKETIRENALTTVTADAYEAFEKQRKETTSKYTIFFDKQITDNVLRGYNKSLKNTNIDAVVAANNILAGRGDYDKIEQYISHFLDHTANADGTIDFTNQKEYIKFGSDFANTLFSNMLSFKDAAPILGRFAKFGNMETWQASQGHRVGHENVTFREYVTGRDVNAAGDVYSDPKTSMETLLQGTDLTKIDRTGFSALTQAIEQYFPNDEKTRTRIVSNFVPQMISAIPTFQTDGEQIMNTLGFLTGMKWDTKNQMWREDGPIHEDIINTYMKGLTDKDINVFKTNAYQAICSALAAKNHKTVYETTDGSGEVRYDADGIATNLVRDPVSGKPKFAPNRNIKDTFRGLVKPEVIAALQNNINNGTNVGMKPTVMDAFGLTIPGSNKNP